MRESATQASQEANILGTETNNAYDARVFLTLPEEQQGGHWGLSSTSNGENSIEVGIKSADLLGLGRSL